MCSKLFKLILSEIKYRTTRATYEGYLLPNICSLKQLQKPVCLCCRNLITPVSFLRFCTKNMLYGSIWPNYSWRENSKFWSFFSHFGPFQDFFSAEVVTSILIEVIKMHNILFVVSNFGDPFYQKSSIYLHIFCTFFYSTVLNNLFFMQTFNFCGTNQERNVEM